MALRLTQCFPRQQNYFIGNSRDLLFYNVPFIKVTLSLKGLPSPQAPRSCSVLTCSSTGCGLVLSSSTGPSLPCSAGPLLLGRLCLWGVCTVSPKRLLLLPAVLPALQELWSLLSIGEVLKLSSLSRAAGRNQSAQAKGGTEGESSLSSMLASIPSSWSMVALTWST